MIISLETELEIETKSISRKELPPKKAHNDGALRWLDRREATAENKQHAICELGISDD